MSPSQFHPRSPEENVEGLGGEPEPEQDQGSMSSGSLRRYRAHIAQDTFQGFRGALRERNGNVDASIGDPPAPAFARVSPDNAQLPPSLSWGSLDSGSRSTASRDTSSGKFAIQDESAPSPTGEGEPGALHQDIQPDAQGGRR